MGIFGTIGKILSPVKVHTHSLPRCNGGGHHGACEGRGKRIICRVMFKGGARFCVCVHAKIG